MGQSTVSDQKITRPQARSIEQSSGETQIRSERVETVVIHNTPAWLIWSLVVTVIVGTVGWIHGWLTPSPRERKLMRKNK